MKTVHYLPIAMAIATLAPSACTGSFPAGIDYSASGGSGGGGGDSGMGGVGDAAGVATGGTVAAGGTAGNMTGGSTGCVPAGKTSPLAMLPASNEIGIWALSAVPVSVNNDTDLYGMIDGAAPKYIDRGWVRSAYATYQQRSGGSTTEVAIHDMGTKENADTLFKVDLPVSRFELGPNAEVDMGESPSYVAHGWTGQYYIEVALDDRSDAALASVKAFILTILDRVCTVGTDAGSPPDAPPASPAFKMVSAGVGAACGPLGQQLLGRSHAAGALRPASLRQHAAG